MEMRAFAFPRGTTRENGVGSSAIPLSLQPLPSLRFGPVAACGVAPLPNAVCLPCSANKDRAML